MQNARSQAALAALLLSLAHLPAAFADDGGKPVLSCSQTLANKTSTFSLVRERDGYYTASYSESAPGLTGSSSSAGGGVTENGEPAGAYVATVKSLTCTFAPASRLIFQCGLLNVRDPKHGLLYFENVVSSQHQTRIALREGLLVGELALDAQPIKLIGYSGFSTEFRLRHEPLDPNAGQLEPLGTVCEVF